MSKTKKQQSTDLKAIVDGLNYRDAGSIAALIFDKLNGGLAINNEMAKRSFVALAGYLAQEGHPDSMQMLAEILHTHGPQVAVDAIRGSYTVVAPVCEHCQQLEHEQESEQSSTVVN